MMRGAGVRLAERKPCAISLANSIAAAERIEIHISSQRISRLSDFTCAASAVAPSLRRVPAYKYIFMPSNATPITAASQITYRTVGLTSFTWNHHTPFGEALTPRLGAGE